jgi:hypothetical protein
MKGFIICVIVLVAIITALSIFHIIDIPSFLSRLFGV